MDREEKLWVKKSRIKREITAVTKTHLIMTCEGGINNGVAAISFTDMGKCCFYV